MAAPELPAGFILVPLSKGTILVLTSSEFRLGLRRGKWWQRATANAMREAKVTSPEIAPAISGESPP